MQVRGIFTNVIYSFGYHAPTGLTGDQMTPLVWESTTIRENFGFKVRAWVCDGVSQNRKCFEINSCKEFPNLTYNIASQDGKKINFFLTFHICSKQPVTI